jgi:predicted nucleotidyltransferase
VESEICAIREAEVDARREIEEHIEQTQALESVIEDQKQKFALIKNAEVRASDIDIVVRCAAQGTLLNLRTIVE